MAGCVVGMDRCAVVRTLPNTPKDVVTLIRSYSIFPYLALVVYPPRSQLRFVFGRDLYFFFLVPNADL